MRLIKRSFCHPLKKKTAKAQESDGCTGVPDWDPSTRSCCEIHDADYDIGGGLIAKTKSDIKFFWCLWGQKQHNPIKRYSIAIIYFIGVTIFGIPFWDWK
jgi:hypothetical protein